MAAIRRVIFDLNGTLVVGKYPDWHQILEERFELDRKTEGKLSLKTLRSVAKGRQSLIEVFSNLYELTEDPEFMTNAFDCYVSNILLRANAIKVLEKLRNKYELFLCSDTTGAAKVVVKKLKLEKYFSKMLFSCDVGFLKSEKGFWIQFLSIVQSASPNEFIVIGDNPRPDVYWPKRLGMYTILIESDIVSPQDYIEKPTGSIYERPDHKVKGLEEVLNHLI